MSWNVLNVHSTLRIATMPMAIGKTCKGSKVVRSVNHRAPWSYRLGSRGLLANESHVDQPLKFLNVIDIHTHKGTCAAGKKKFL